MICAALPANPIDRLLGIAERLRALDDTENADWLRSAVMRHVETGELIDRAFGLSGNLGRSPRFDYLRRERNRHLEEALHHVGGEYARLAEEICRFESRLLPMWRHRLEAPGDWSPVRVAIHRAFRVCATVPTSTCGLRKALTSD
ncbi:MAG: hypothetical protein Q7U78_03060 [Gallionella sp.]|nr:hypothetical protein [Gallionella sp.]